MTTNRFRRAVAALAVLGAAAACEGSSTFLGESDGGDGTAVDTFWSVPLDAGADTGADADADAVVWRDSTAPWAPPAVPYCEAQWDPMPFDLWADATGIYVLYAWERPRPAEGGSWFFSEPPVLHISYNGGAGWSDFFHDSCERFDSGSMMCLTELGGVLEGRLLGWGSPGGVYGFEPWMVERMWPDLYNVGSMFVVNDHLAYAMWQAGPDSRVVRYDGEGWSPVPVALPFDSAAYGRIWADEQDVFVAGASAVLLSLEGEEWQIHDPGTISELTAVWGFAGDDVWVGTADGQLRHFDGTTWSGVEWPSRDDGSLCNEDKPILAMWGAEGILYFITETQFARWDGTRVEVLGHWPNRYDDRPGVFQCVGDGLRPVALGGNSPTEVFLLVTRQTSHLGRFCEGSAVLWWDGTTLRQI
jgi:hypothetical protein